MAEYKDFLEKEQFSTEELASLLGVSRIAVFKKIKKGDIKANKIGRNYIIPRSEVGNVLGLFISTKEKNNIENTVKKAVKQYGADLRKLGKE